MTLSALQQIEKALEDKLTPKEVAEEILSKLAFATVSETKEILVYDNGIYVAGGESLIETEVEKLVPDCTNHFCAEVIGHIKRETFHSILEFDRDDYIINVKNGIIDVTTGNLTPHNALFLSRTQLPVAYDANAKCPRLIKFLEQVMPNSEERTALLQHAAYTLIRSCFLQKAFLYVGKGANGKSTWFNVLIALLGKANVANVSIHDLECDRFACSSLDGKFANIYEDINSTEIGHTGKLKNLIVGDSISVQKKHKQPYDLPNRAKLFFSANQLPEVEDSSDAWYRRWVIIEWGQPFTGIRANRALPATLSDQAELSGLLTIILRIAKKLLEKRALSYEPSIQQMRAEWFDKANIIQAFLNSEVKVDQSGYVSKGELYSAYSNWCQTKYYAPQGKRAFNEALQQRLPVREDFRKPIGGKNTRVWLGISFKNTSTSSTNFTAQISSSSESHSDTQSVKQSQQTGGDRRILLDFDGGEKQA